MKKIDKVRAVALVPISVAEENKHMVLARLEYDVRKLRRLDEATLTEILFEKTLKLYPFAIVEKRLAWLMSHGSAAVQMWLPIAPGMLITKDKRGK